MLSIGKNLIQGGSKEKDPNERSIVRSLRKDGS